MVSIEIDPPARPREQLACRLYETMQRLAPGAGDYIEWDDLSTWYRDLYLNCIDALLVDRDVLVRAIHLCDNDMVEGALQEREKLDGYDVVRLSIIDSAIASVNVMK